MIEFIFVVVFTKKSGKRSIEIKKQYPCNCKDIVTWIGSNADIIEKERKRVYAEFEDVNCVRVINPKIL